MGNFKGGSRLCLFVVPLAIFLKISKNWTFSMHFQVCNTHIIKLYTRSLKVTDYIYLENTINISQNEERDLHQISWGRFSPNKKGARICLSQKRQPFVSVCHLLGYFSQIKAIMIWLVRDSSKYITLKLFNYTQLLKAANNICLAKNANNTAQLKMKKSTANQLKLNILSQHRYPIKIM